MALPKILSVDEFMVWLEKQPEKYEYFGGRIHRRIVAEEDGPTAMAGGAPKHNAMEVNVTTALQSRLRGRGCRAYGSNQLVKNVDWNEAFFPDAMIVCGEMEMTTHGTLQAVSNPSAVIEILSPTTRDFDRYHKLYAYQAMPSVQEIVLIEATKAIVERYIRVEDGWRFEATIGLGSVARIFDLDIPMAEIYEDVEFPPEPEE